MFADEFRVLEGRGRVGHGQPLNVIFGKQPPVGGSQLPVFIQAPVGVGPKLVRPLLAGPVYQSAINERSYFVELLPRIIRAQAGALVVPAPQKRQHGMMWVAGSVLMPLRNGDVEVFRRTARPLCV